LREHARNVLSPPGASCGRTMLEAIWLGGAQALRRNSGKLAPGASADILTFQANHPTLAGKVDDQVLDAWIFSGGNALVDCVWSDGLKVVVGGRHVFRDEIAEQFKKTMRDLSQSPVS
jgi:formimidoylglutamate deiminase